MKWSDTKCNAPVLLCLMMVLLEHQSNGPTYNIPPARFLIQESNIPYAVMEMTVNIQISKCT